MSNKLFVALFIIVANVQFAISQNMKATGYITDSKSGESVIGAYILDKTSGNTCVSNKFGYFSLNVNSKKLSLRCSSVGYKLKFIDVNINSDTILNIELEPETYELKEVVVNGKQLEDKLETGKVNIPISTIRSLPSLMGEPDVLKAYQLMPGVQVGNEANNGLYVRGGSPDQNLFLLDDIPLYNVNHLGGLFSVFDYSIIKNIDLYKGGFPARYGGRTSSVIDIRTKDGNMQKLDGEIGLGLLTSKVFLEGPIKKDKASFAASVRYSNLGIYSFLYNKFQGINYTEGYTFYDVSLKGNVKLSEFNRLYMSFFTGKDVIYYSQKENTTTNNSYQINSSQYSNINWGNLAGSFRWLHLLKNGYFNNITLALTKYNYNNIVESKTKSTSSTEEQNILNEYTIKSSSNDIILKSDFEMPKEKIDIKLGGNIGFHSYIPSATFEKYLLNGVNQLAVNDTNQNLSAFDILLYTEMEYAIAKKISANAGLRTGFYYVDNTFFPVLEPRVILNYHFLPDYSLKASYSRMSQQIHLLSNSGAGLPTDIWVPSTKNIKPESSDQISASLAHSIRDDYEFSVDMYVKYMHNLIDYKDGALVYSSSTGWDEKVVNNGIGRAKGIEFLVRKKTGRLTGWVGYTLSSNTRQFKDINDGKPYPYIYEQRNNISVVGNYKFNDRWEVTTAWIYHTGNHITLPVERYTVYWEFYNGNSTPEPTDIYVYSSKNGYKMPDYHRLDIGFFYTPQKYRNRNVRWSFNIYNAYNHQNAYYLYYKESSDGTLKLYQKTIFPILLNIGYIRSF